MLSLFVACFKLSTNSTLGGVMSNPAALSLIILFCAIVIVTCLVVLYMRQKKINQAINEDVRRKDQELKLWREKTYVLHVYLDKEAEPHIQRAQARTGSESPEHLACDALDFYVKLIERYSEGCRLYLSKPPYRKAFLFNFEPLHRVVKKVEG